MPVGFDYTARDFDSIRAELIRRMKEAVPEWTTYDAGFESVLIDMWAAVGDVLNFYTDRMGNEAFIQSAVLKESVLNLAQMFGYLPSPQTAATLTMEFTKSGALAENVTIPAGTRVYSQQEGLPPIIYETIQAATIVHASSNSVQVDAVEGVAVKMERIGSSTGEEQLRLPLYNPNVIKDSIRIYTQDGSLDVLTGQPSLIEWTPFDRLVDANFYDRAFSSFTDDGGVTYVRFGDNVSGLIPAVGTEIFATYKYGVGKSGNIGVGAIRGLVDNNELAAKLVSATNVTAGQGGADVESLESMRSSVPKSLRTLERAVTIDDYAELIVSVPGIAKASAESTNGVAVTIAIAPVGGGQPTTTLQNRALAYIERRDRIDSTPSIIGPTYVNVNVTVSVTVNPAYRQDVVKAQVLQAIKDLFLFDVQEFGARITHADVFHAAAHLNGVDYLTISAFNRDGSGDDADFTLATTEIAQAGTITVNASGGVVIS